MQFGKLFFQFLFRCVVLSYIYCTSESSRTVASYKCIVHPEICLTSFPYFLQKLLDIVVLPKLKTDKSLEQIFQSGEFI